MKLGVLTVLFGGLPLEAALDKVKAAGLDAVEIGAGGYPGTAHCNPDELLGDARRLEAFKSAIESRGLFISALSCHGNPVHPNPATAAAYIRAFRSTVLLAERLGITRVIGFSGCPGDSDGSAHPNWVTCPWPDDFLKVLDYQWNMKLIPYWKEEAAFARDHGVDKICLEMHPGFCVYSPETLLKLRDAVGDSIGANFDPSHLFWQGIDPAAAIKALKGAIYHFHAKDTRVDQANTRVNGVLDTKHYGNELNRSWIFRTVGYGHSYDTWKDIISALRMVGYDYVLSIEHEDSLLSVEEGFNKAVAFLKQVVASEPKGAMWWA
jgi:sugar phosphate isomerase/epimerase